MKYFCLSFDLEEFDLPREYEIDISDDDMFKISLEGTKRVLDLVKKHSIKATFFVTTGFCKKYPALIKSLSKVHEVACHGEHGKDYSKMEKNEAAKSIKQNKLLLEKVIKKKVTGFRAPRMSSPDYELLKKVGFEYDASLHPTYVPGRYNNLLKPRKIFNENGMIIIPTSVTPVVRAPITWLWFRNFGLAYAKTCTRLCLLTDPYVNIYFHPWEFVSLSEWDIPLMFKRNTGKAVYNKLDKYISWLIHKKVRFVTLNDLLKKFTKVF